jgi:hypothetical protein
VRAQSNATPRREDACSIEERVCMFSQDGHRSPHGSTSFVVVAKTRATESKIWIDFGSFRERTVAVRQESGGEPPTFDDFGHAGESDGRLCQRQLDVAMHACKPGQPQPLL